MSHRYTAYFHPKCDRIGAQSLLTPQSAGVFLLRESSDRLAEVSMSIRTSTSMVNLRIYKTHDGLPCPKFFLDSPERHRSYFPSIDSLLHYYLTRKEGILYRVKAEETESGYPMLKTVFLLRGLKYTEEPSRKIDKFNLTNALFVVL